MKKLTIQAFHRTELYGKNARKTIQKGYVPGVLYGGSKEKNIHFYLHAIDLQPLNYDPYFIDLQVEKETYPCILQAKQVHPVSDIPIHIDLLRTTKDSTIIMEIPVKITGKSIGELKGGLLIKKIRKLKIQALPENMPEIITLDVSHLDLGQSIQVKETPTDNFIICNAATSLVVTIDIPRALRSKQDQEEGKK